MFYIRSAAMTNNAAINPPIVKARVGTRRVRAPRKIPDLPVYYYLTNFENLMAEIEARYKGCLDEEALDFISRFAALPEYARCLYVRLAGRKGRVFDLGRLNYEEIKHLKDQAEQLRRSGFIRDVNACDFEDYLRGLTKPDLAALMCKHLDTASFKKSWKKDLLVQAALDHLAFEHIDIPGNWIVQARTDALDYMLFLYFGKITPNLQPFTLRDLGLMRAPDWGEDYAARFDDFGAARSAYFYARALYDFKQGREDHTARLIDNVHSWPAPQESSAEAARDKLLQKLGGLSERLGDVETALLLYSRSDAPLCNERVIRLRYKAGDKDWVKVRLEALIDNPGSDDELIFASDFYARKFNGKRTSLMTDILREAEIITLDEAFRNMPERAAAHHYREEGFAARRAENAPWRALFGLAFWPLLFGDKSAGLHSAFDRLPADLKLGTFYESRKDEIEERLNQFSSPDAALSMLLRELTHHYGQGNAIFRWSPALLDDVRPMINLAGEGCAQILRAMAKDWKNTRDGFPDLMLHTSDTLRFVEIKAEGDALRRNQLTRLQQLRRAGFSVDVARINWIVDPEQDYVVVDIETTGGRPGAHRITEIGAVKLRGGVVVDEWSSLINPQRPIPPFITKLTGIHDNMVAGAPLFAQVADDFAGFMEGAIFAAHNVNFDYGFIAMEYERLGQYFQFPKICTVASMRRYYPGHKSYGLKNLCAAYDIELTSHHRALCDAKAAAELLLLVNAKRME